MWTPTTRAQHSRAGLRYGSDMRDDEWAILEPLLPAPRSRGRKQGLADAPGRGRDLLRAARGYPVGHAAQVLPAPVHGVSLVRGVA